MTAADALAACLGYVVIAGACVVKIPQIVLILSNKSVEGLSEAMVVLAAWLGIVSWVKTHLEPEA